MCDTSKVGKFVLHLLGELALWDSALEGRAILLQNAGDLLEDSDGEADVFFSLLLDLWKLFRGEQGGRSFLEGGI